MDVKHEHVLTVFLVTAGVYLSKYSDLLQINPFEAGSTGDMIVFKVMRVRPLLTLSGPFKDASVAAREAQPVSFIPQGRLKHIHENMPKNSIEPSPKFDGHLSKSANRVTSLLSYRAFELTQVGSAPGSDSLRFKKSISSRFNVVFYFFRFS